MLIDLRKNNPIINHRIPGKLVVYLKPEEDIFDGLLNADPPQELQPVKVQPGVFEIPPGRWDLAGRWTLVLFKKKGRWVLRLSQGIFFATDVPEYEPPDGKPKLTLVR